MTEQQTFYAKWDHAAFVLDARHVDAGLWAGWVVRVMLSPEAP